MQNFIKEFFEILKENEKETLIRRSGSTRENSNEKIRSGQSYLYKLHGMESEVLEIRFAKKVHGSPLNRALTETMRRYPYFSTRLIEKGGDFYIVQNDVSPVARKTKTLAALGGAQCGYHLIDITYFERSVYLSFHHALCDGRGVKPFAETLVWYYCKFAYGNEKTIEGVRLAGEPLLPGETDDPFLETYDYDTTKNFISLPRDAFSLPESAEPSDGADYRFEASIPHDEFMAACKRENATPVILLSLLVSRAVAEVCPDYDKPINANIATDMRKELGHPNTFKNCVKSIILPYGRDFAALSTKAQATRYRELLNAQRDRDYCRREADAMLALFDKLDSLPSYEEKRKIMAFFEGMLLNTYVVSYLGQFVLGDNAQYIESIHLYNSGTAGLGVNMIACGEKFVLDFKQSFTSERYVAAFLSQAEKEGLHFEAGERIEFTTPTDKLLKRKI